MTVVINGTTGITSVNGSAAAPSVTGTDTDTGIVYGTNTLSLATGGTTGLIQDASQNIGLRSAPSAWGSYYPAIENSPASAFSFAAKGNEVQVVSNIYQNNSFQSLYATAGQAATKYVGSAPTGVHTFYSTSSTGAAGNQITDLSSVLAFGKNTTVALQGASVQSGTGITFPATQSASSDANTLDDYEEGTFTPQLYSDATQASGYTSQVGYYRKIGSQVTLWFAVSAATIPAGTYLRIAGLPFSVNMSGTGYQNLNSAGAGNAKNPIYLETYTGTSGQAFATATGYANPSSFASVAIGGVYTYIAS